MNSTWKVFEMNDCDWWIARNAAEAEADFVKNYADIGQIMEGCPRELTAEELGRLQFIDSENDKNKCSFAEELARQVVTSPKVGMFATTEF